MYDPDTADLIKRAPQLAGLSNTDLPKLLTNAYAEIVAGRIRLRDTAWHEDNENVLELIARMRRLALANEALVSANIERENRQSAAFVAGSAHHVVLMAKRTSETGFSSLGTNSISSEVAAALLFLIAEASADAAEMAKHIHIPPERTVEATLLRCIKNLAEGKLMPIVESQLPSDFVSGFSIQDAAINILYSYLFSGLVNLARRLLGQAITFDPDQFFAEAKRIASDDIGSLFGTTPGVIVSSYPGPIRQPYSKMATTFSLTCPRQIKAQASTSIAATKSSPALHCQRRTARAFFA